MGIDWERSPARASLVLEMLRGLREGAATHVEAADGELYRPRGESSGNARPRDILACCTHTKR